MHCIKELTDNLFWIGGNNRQISFFERMIPLPNGISFNSYFLDDEKTVLFDTVDFSISTLFLENLQFVLHGRLLDYLIITHLEPDHSALITLVVEQYPDVQIFCTKATELMISNFFSQPLQICFSIVNDNTSLCTGKHLLQFITAPMVHWPEVLMVYDQTSKTLFSADAFGGFGALHGSLFLQDDQSKTAYLDEALRYYANIIGRYGNNVMSLLTKLNIFSLRMICPLHGFCWSWDSHTILSKYRIWGAWQPEISGVLIICGSIYGNTENIAQNIALRLDKAGIPCILYDASSTDISYIVAKSFSYSHIIIASSTYNNGIFPPINQILDAFAVHRLQNRTFSVIQNGSWAPAAANLICRKLATYEHCRICSNILTIRTGTVSSEEIVAFIDSLQLTPTIESKQIFPQSNAIPNEPFFDIQYGLFILAARCNGVDNGCILNTVMQVTDFPKQIVFAIQKNTLTCSMIQNTGIFALSIISRSASLSLFQHFGYQSGHAIKKFLDFHAIDRADNGVLYVTQHTTSFIAGRTLSAVDCGTHLVFICEVTQAQKISQEPAATYEWYYSNSKTAKISSVDSQNTQTGNSAGLHKWRCRVCGYVFEGTELTEEYVCPVCRHDNNSFEEIV